MKLTYTRVFCPQKYRKGLLHLLSGEFGLLAGHEFWISGSDLDNLEIHSRKDQAVVGYVRIIPSPNRMMIVQFDGMSDLDVRYIAPFADRIIALMQARGFMKGAAASTGANVGQPPSATSAQSNKRGIKAGTLDRVRRAHELLKQGKISRRAAFKQAHTDSRTYIQYCKTATGDEPIEPYNS